jgi:hypothetical protein
MQRDKMRKSFKRLGIPPRDYRVLKLLPLVYVAWADGKMAQVEKDRIRQLARHQYHLGPAGAALLDRWLEQPPTRAYVAEALHDIYFLARAVDELDVDYDELQALLGHAEALAHTSAEALDEPRAVTPEEERALEEMARELHVDRGESWTQLVREVNGAR